MKIQELLEAKFKKPEIFYHGTSYAHFNLISKNGMNPTPVKRNYSDNDASEEKMSMESLDGSYWAKSPEIAYEYSINATRFAGDNSMVLVAQIATQSAVADEDNVSEIVDTTIFNHIHGTSAEQYMAIVTDGDLELRNRISQDIHNNLTNNKNKPVFHRVLDKITDLAILRVLSYNKRDLPPHVAELVPDSPIAEKNYLKARDLIARYYRDSAEHQDDSTRTLRYLSPIGFRGASKITHIISVLPGLGVIYVKYGNRATLPQELVTAIEKFHNFKFDVRGGVKKKKPKIY